ncbi:MAG: PSD1 and planctomycete cytochrome C domain-containing protein [Planctomycetales bacterium]
MNLSRVEFGMAPFRRQQIGRTVERLLSVLSRGLWQVVVTLCCGLSLSGASVGDEPDASSATPQFERDVHPLLKTYCWKCHGGDGFAAELDLRSLPLIAKGSKSGKVLVPGAAEKSPLYQKLAAKEMPPGNELKPTEAHIQTIKAWIEAGAPARYQGGGLTVEEAPPLEENDRQWWAFRTPVRPPLPVVREAHLVRTPIDAFLLAKLEQRQWSFSPEADRVSLLRRAFLDLVGLPPTPEEAALFLNDQAPGAWERLIDRLLDSPHYGERWGRHWLDAAGYVDVIGTDNDASIIELREGVWQYRDYVVRAFNEDKPYDRFLLEQLAGDELIDWRNAPRFTPEIKNLLVATGFLRQAADVTYAPELNTADIRHQVLYDTLQIFSSNVLGLTVHCAQCHSHKFDPLAQADYYRFLAVFAPAYNVQNWKHSKERHLPDVSAAEKQAIDDHNAQVDRQVADFNKQLGELRAPVRQNLFDARLAALPEAIRQDTKSAVETPADKRTEVQKYLADKLGGLLAVKPEEIAAALDEPARQRVATLEQQLAAAQGSRRSYGKIQAIWEVSAPPAAYLYRRGGYETPGPLVAPGFPKILTEAVAPPALAAAPGASSSGYRTALAQWLVQPRHPLTARVVVNRVWQQYFGRGIVSTPDNFGRSGALPSHPELLDWLATEFMRSGWSFKKLHRLIMTSAVYRQSSQTSLATAASGASTPTAAEPQSEDPDNLLLSRMPLRRLESEIIRDALLAVSGRLDGATGGPPVPVKPLPDGMVVVETQNLPAGQSPFRRSLYLVTRRNYQPTELSVFDQPIVATNCTRRTSAAVALQSLAMLNGQFVTEQSEAFARRVIAAAGSDEPQRIDLAFRLALARSPTAEELELSRQLLARQRQRKGAEPETTPAQADGEALFHLCHMLLNTNEFLYVP